MTTLLRLDAHPLMAPEAWETIIGYVAARAGALTVVLNVADGPGNGRDPAYTAAAARLRTAGARLLGYVDLRFATRPPELVVADVYRWAGYPVHGVFLDRAPTSPYSIGPVAVAVAAARRAGLPDAVLNPGEPPDPSYRTLGAAICVFDGSWRRYRHWDGAGAQPGDGHLVHAVPPDALDEAWLLQAVRHAGFGMVSDLVPPHGYATLPAWLTGPAAPVPV
ncbi:spherulation-specific family 4 protein [Planosporangium sp. 12N6]|uniref:spherulation-specific family 4 protein n=1 Tax=Planosporangium spinosum TaxID=3402278 RepID=UPI003CEBC2AC